MALGGLVLLFGVCGYAGWKGGAAERWAALIVLVCWVGDTGLHAVSHTPELSQWVDIGSDVLVGAGFLVLALAYQSQWVAIVLLLQGAMLSLHALQIYGAGTGRYWYAAAANATSLSLLAILLSATAWPLLRASRPAPAPRAPVR